MKCQFGERLTIIGLTEVRDTTAERENRNRSSSYPCSTCRRRWRCVWPPGRDCACSSAAVPAGRSSRAGARRRTCTSSSCSRRSSCPADSCSPFPWSAARLDQSTHATTRILLLGQSNPGPPGKFATKTERQKDDGSGGDNWSCKMCKVLVKS